MPMRLGAHTAGARIEAGSAVSVETFTSGALGPAHFTSVSETGDSFAICEEMAALCEHVVQNEGCRRLLEFGAGTSSLVLSRALASGGGGMLTSVEQDPGWCSDTWEVVETLPGVDAVLVKGRVRTKLERDGLGIFWHGIESLLSDRAPFDFVLIDAPQVYYGRGGVLASCFDLLAPGALIVLDDLRRRGEQRAVSRWLKTYSGLAIEAFDPSFGRGVAVLKVQRRLKRRFSLSASIESAIDYMHRARARAQLRLKKRAI